MIVKDSMVTFYTCSASTFIFNVLGTGNLKVWLKSDIGTSCSTSGCSLTTWNDQSPSLNNATRSGTVNPIFVPSKWNFNPAIRFDN